MSVIDGAVGVLRIAVAKIVEALRAATVEKGLDPREMTLVAFGGAGPMFACEVAEQLEIERIIVPPAAGLLSSLGLLLAEPLHNSARTVLKDAGDVNPGELETIFRKMEGRAANLLHKEGVKQSDVKYQRLLEMRYQVNLTNCRFHCWGGLLLGVWFVLLFKVFTGYIKRSMDILSRAGLLRS